MSENNGKTPLLEIRNLSVHFKVYGGELRVLDGINFHVNAGERVGLVGETGCGKTTTMKAILRVLPMPPAVIPNGEVYFKGQDVFAMSQNELVRMRGHGMSMIFQDPTAALNPVFTVGQQIRTVIKHAEDQQRVSKQELQARAVQSLREVALADPERLLDSYPIQLSGGMRQRVCIGMALSTNPELLIGDEPGTALDVTIQDQVLRLLQDLVERKGNSFILITHTLGVVRQMTDRVYVMYAGNMVEVAPTKRLFAQPLHPYTQGLMSAVPKLSGGGITEGIPGRIPEYKDPPPGCRFHPRCPHVMPVCKRVKPPSFAIPIDKIKEPLAMDSADDRQEVACFLYDEPHKVAAYKAGEVEVEPA